MNHLIVDLVIDLHSRAISWVLCVPKGLAFTEFLLVQGLVLLALTLGLLLG